jgi:hypothetical protein
MKRINSAQQNWISLAQRRRMACPAVGLGATESWSRQPSWGEAGANTTVEAKPDLAGNQRTVKKVKNKC